MSPIVETITSVTSERTSSPIGCVRCVHARRIPASTTDPTAMASTMYQVEFCRNPTVELDPSGAELGMTHATSEEALVMRNTPASTTPSRPRLSIPVSSDRARI
ncbi:hypothetical protein BFL35_02970 [Clavibacter michiganensis]|nr:hypothetical protein BFL35_02970 [Clavibacter michiganensis]